jgi:hypothetical protein
MRFFTDHFFSEEQKAELLGDRYAPARRMSGLARDAAQSRVIEAVQTQEWLQREQDEFDRRAKLAELFALPLVVLISLAFGLSVSYLLDVL